MNPVPPSAPSPAPAAAGFDLRGRVALVAGGAGYLGQPICAALAACGATVVLADLPRAIPAAADPARAIALDAGDPASCESAVAACVAAHGRLDILVNATYASSGAALAAITPEQLDHAARVNLTGGLLLARAAADRMPAGGSIVWFASMYGLVAPDPRVYHPPMAPNPVDYGACKAGVIQMVRYLAAHYGPRGIRVNAVAPGPFPHAATQTQQPDFCDRLAARTMLGRLGRQHETAGPVLFLASDAASYVTGQCLAIDGGWTQW